MPEEATVDLSAEETHVPSLDDASYDEQVAESTEDSTEQVEEQPQEDRGKYGFGDPDLDARIDAWTKRAKHLDPANPEHLKTLRSLAEKDRMIERFKEIQDKFDPGNPEHAALAKELFGTQGGEAEGESEAEPAALTEFEKSLEEKPPTEEGKGDEEKPTETPKSADEEVEDVGKGWKHPNDAYDALTAAWSEIQDQMAKAAEDGKRYVPDFSKVNAIETALLDRRLDAMVSPVIQELNSKIEKIVEKFGGVLPDLEKSVSQQRLADTKAFALSELSKTGQYADVDKMFQAIDGPPITINGEKFANTPFHKAVAQAPWIMDIHAKGKDRQTTERLTMIARLRAAHQVLNGTAKSREQVKRALEAGQKLTERNREDRVRQGLNSGAGTNSFESSGKKGSYVDSLNSEEEMSVLDL